MTLPHPENSETSSFSLRAQHNATRVRPSTMGDAVPPEDTDVVAEVLYSESAIKARVAELGVEIAEYYRDVSQGSEGLVVLPVMSGAMIFAADLTRAMRPRVKGMVVETIKAKSYEGTSSSGTVKVDANASQINVKDKDVLLVEDIVDTGGTMVTLENALYENGAASVRMVSLIDKTIGRSTETSSLKPHWAGFKLTENKFVVGYGLDFNGAYRELEYVGVLKPEMYS